MQQELVELIQALVAIDSINPDLVPGGAGEVKIAQYVANWLESAGLQVRYEEVARGRPNVVAVAKGSGGGKSLMLNAHLDTVGVAGMQNPLTPILEGNRLYGRGAYDMKASLAAIMMAGLHAVKNPLRGNVIITAVADEEYASIGTQAIARKWQADAAIVTEPTALDICIAHKGFVWLEVETQGRAAHGSRPDLGVDAIAKMGKVLVALEQHGNELLQNSTHPLLHSGSIHASLISGGQELSSYPEKCLLKIERRTLPGETSEVVLNQIQAVLSPIAEQDSLFHAESRVLLERPPFQIYPEEPIVQILRHHAKMRRGVEPNLVGATFWMDSALLAEVGIPTVIFGPTGDGAHAVVEWVDLESVAQCLDILNAVIVDFCR